MTETTQAKKSPPMVFISHEKTDTGIAQEIRAHLEADGYSCWLAPDDIRGPNPWPEQINRAINSCDVMLVVISADANESPHVSREVDLAVESGKPLLPVRVSDVVPTGTLNYLLRLAQWIDLFPGPIADHAEALQGMVGAMVPGRVPVAAPQVEPAPRAGVLSAPTEPVPPSAAPAEDRPRRRAGLLLVLLLLFVGVALAAGIVLGLGLGGDESASDDVEVAPGESSPDETPASGEEEEEPGPDEPELLLNPTFLEVRGPTFAVVGRALELEVTGLGRATDATAAWSIDGADAGSGRSFAHTFDAPGAFTVSVELRAGEEVQTLGTEIEVLEPLSINIGGADDSPYPSGTLFRLQAQTRGGKGPWTFTWTLPDGSQPTGEFVSDLGFPAGTHEVSVEAVPVDDALKDIEGLSTTQTIQIELRQTATTSERPRSTTPPPTTAPPPPTTCPRIEPPEGYPVTCP